MIFKNVLNWDCCAFPKLLNTERMTLISSKCNAWPDVLPECGTQDERPLFPPICSSAPIRGGKKTNVLICLDLGALEPMAELINPAVMYYLCKSLRSSPCGEVDTECWVGCPALWQMRMVNFYFFIILWYQQLLSHVNIFAPRVRSNYALHHHWCWNQLYQSY